jgi:hypothetical protein
MFYLIFSSDAVFHFKPYTILLPCRPNAFQTGETYPPVLTSAFKHAQINVKPAPVSHLKLHQELIGINSPILT